MKTFLAQSRGSKYSVVKWYSCLQVKKETDEKERMEEGHHKLVEHDLHRVTKPWQ